MNRGGSRGGGRNAKQVYRPKAQSSSSSSTPTSSSTDTSVHHHSPQVGNNDSSNDFSSRRRGGLFDDAGEDTGLKSLSRESGYSREQLTPSPSFAEASSRMQNLRLDDVLSHTGDRSSDQLQSSSFSSNLESDFPPLSTESGGKVKYLKGTKREQTANTSRESSTKSESSDMLGSGIRNGQASYKNTHGRGKLYDSPNMNPGIDSAIGRGQTKHEKQHSGGRYGNSHEKQHSGARYGNSPILQPGLDSGTGHGQNTQDRTYSRGKFGNSQIMHPVVDTGIQHSPASPEKTHSGGKLENSNIPNTGVPFDICWTRTGVQLKTSLLLRNKERRNENKRFMEGQSINVLRPGMVHLSRYISPTDQIKIIEKCRKLGLGPGGFYQPGYSDGAKLNLKMMCLGKNWDPQTSRYDDVRPDDGAKPPSIPDEFYELVKRAINDSHAHLMKQSAVKNVEYILPSMTPDVCIVNFYNNTGRLGLHQDKDESQESLRRGLPVVSFSIGASAEFVYGDDRDVEKAEKVVLESGDVLIFGGKSRHVFHGVTTIKPDTGPKILFEETNMKAGRLNLTFRQY